MSKHDEEIFTKIRQWARNRDIFRNGDSKTQTLKLGEEFGELCQAVLKRDDVEVYDAIGDCVVVLTNIVHLYELEKLNANKDPMIIKTIEDCIQDSYDVIAKRQGSMINGTFVKND